MVFHNFWITAIETGEIPLHQVMVSTEYEKTLHFKFEHFFDGASVCHSQVAVKVFPTCMKLIL